MPFRSGSGYGVLRVARSATCRRSGSRPGDAPVLALDGRSAPGGSVLHLIRGRRLKREDVASRVRPEGKIEGMRCSPHTLRHTGAKRFILNGAMCSRSRSCSALVMVRRYVELAAVDLCRQHERYSPADSPLPPPAYKACMGSTQPPGEITPL